MHQDEILFHEFDPVKQIPELEVIAKILPHSDKLEKLEKQYDFERNQKPKDYKITLMKQVSVFNAGRGFGELALMNSKPRAASIQALEDCDFATLSKKDYDNIIGEAIKRDLESKTTVLINISAFKHLTRNTLKRMTFFMKEKLYHKNTVLFNENEHVTGLFMVKEGEFEISKRYQTTLNEKYKEKAFPITIRKDIKV